jgi:hypothetical protein
METSSSNVFTSSGHLSKEAMLRYHAGKLSRDDQYAVEKHIAGCRLCSDALDGATSIRKDEHADRILSELRRAVRKRLQRRPAGPASQPYVVAALIFLLLFLLIIYLVFFRSGIL